MHWLRLRLLRLLIMLLVLLVLLLAPALSTPLAVRTPHTNDETRDMLKATGQQCCCCLNRRYTC